VTQPLPTALDQLLVKAVQDNGTLVPTRQAINFTGVGAVVTDDAANNRTNVSIAGGTSTRTSISIAGGSLGTTTTTTLTALQSAFNIIELTGAILGNIYVQVVVTNGVSWTFRNLTTGVGYVILQSSTGTNQIPVGQGQSVTVYSDGTDLWLSCPPASGLIAPMVAPILWWPGNEASGGTLHNYGTTASSDFGTLTNFYTNVAGAPAGELCVEMIGGGASGPTTTPTASDLVLCCWVQLGLTSSTYNILSWNVSSSDVTYLQVASGVPKFTVAGQGTVTATNDQILNPGTWHHVMGRYNHSNGQMLIYIDGNYTGATPGGGGTPTWSGGGWHLGTPGGSGPYGKIQDVRVYDTLNAPSSDQFYRRGMRWN